MINYIVYGNTDYLDVLQIQTDYMAGRGHLTLFINTNTLDMVDIYSKYDKVIFYNGQDQYARRLLTCLEQIDYDYFLFLHDIDILLAADTNMLEKFKDFLSINNFDRVDLKYNDKFTDETMLIKINENTDPSEWPIMFKDEMTDGGTYLIKQDDPTNYIYNVNPSIWKRKSFIELLSNFKDKNYRTIEEIDVQNFSRKFKIFKMFSKVKLDCGYFQCLPIFKYLHISHSGKLLPLNDSFTTVYGQPYNDVSDEYIKIVEKYNLKQSKKWIK